MSRQMNYIYKARNELEIYIKNKHIQYEHGNTPFGYYFCVFENQNILHLIFIDEIDLKNTIENYTKKYRLALSFAPSANSHIFDKDLNILKENMHFILFGTPFQIKVWQSLLSVPFGSHMTYSQLAMNANLPNSCRAVANAIGANPIAYFIPCHRILRKDGGLGGYRWGINRKKLMLSFEENKIISSV
ncbi:methylated-DNA--[protein]-cysteine S-methyltransferase [Fluviispira vulneris]|uniref:methylated-DNA--[protein]-cysteine S-methyltransferase n=1 Tax=Fluviispira vulneris TaxID=2763012 RepID=UPI001646E850|nr:methylated-DNA--[protein]-cysteine S-methyltransferase [Fluviispira vulneris]